VALVERGDDPVGAVHAGQEVTDRHTDTLRVVGVRPGQRHQAALALGDLVVAGAAALGPVVAEAADGEQHEAGVELVQPLDTEPQPVEHPGPEVLEQHVGMGHEAAEGLPPVGGLQVEGHRLLVAVAGQEVRRHRVVRGPDERRPPAAGLVPTVGGLDLDDPGPHVGEHHPAVRPGQGTGQVDDDDVVQWSAHGCSRLRWWVPPT
jgi:hypothetical protein